MRKSMVETQTLTTRNLKYSQKLQYWRDYVCQTFVDLNCEDADAVDFEGEIRSRDAGDIRYSTVTSSPQKVVRDQSKIAKSDHDYFLVSMQLAGQGRVIQNGRAAEIGAGQFALYDVTRPYRLEFKDQYKQLVLRLPRRTLLDRLLEAEDHTAVAVSADISATRLATTLFTQLAEHLPNLDQFTVNRLQNDAVDLLVDAVRAQTQSAPSTQSQSPAQLLHRICRHIETNLSDPDLKPEAIAAAHGISERYLRKLFEKRDKGVAEWIWQRRLENAREDILNPAKLHLSVATIAYDWGFKDPSHFSRAFKGFFGASPREIRKREIRKGGIH
jgi:AraC-like DNA-binding protein